MSEPRQALRIVALLTNPQTVAACLDCARAAAAGLAARIEVCRVGFDPARSLAPPEEIDLRALRDIAAHSSPERRGGEIGAAFAAWCAGAGMTLRLEAETGDVADIAARRTGPADLVVMARPARGDGPDALHGVLFGARRLLLVAPPATQAGVLARHVAIGWKPGAQIERMIGAARPWLDIAERITVLTVASPSGADYGDSARAFFGGLGLPVEVVVLPRGAQSVGQQLAAEAIRRGAGCLGIGAFRHGELWEDLIGGVTRDILSGADLPVFLMT